MVQTLEIEGGLVNLVEKAVIESIPLTEWVARIERRVPVYTPVLPTMTRGTWWDTTDLAAQKMLILMEMPPQTARIDLNGTIHEVAIPWTRFVFFARTTDPNNTLQWSLQDYRIFWAKTRYSNPMVRDMTAALLPNVYEDGRICFGSTGARADQSFADRLDQTVNEFYISRFNNDLVIHRPNGWRGWGSWETMTKTNPMGWMQWDDLDPTKHVREFYSWEDLANQYNRTVAPRQAPVITQDSIPELAIGATFGRTEQWLNTLTNNQRVRLASVLDQNRNDNPGAFVATHEPVGATEDEDN